MLELFWNAAARLAGRPGDAEPAWCRDLLAHPDIERMSPLALADLPMPRGAEREPADPARPPDRAGRC